MNTITFGAAALLSLSHLVAAGPVPSQAASPSVVGGTLGFVTIISGTQTPIASKNVLTVKEASPSDIFPQSTSSWIHPSSEGSIMYSQTTEPTSSVIASTAPVRWDSAASSATGSACTDPSCMSPSWTDSYTDTAAAYSALSTFGTASSGSASAYTTSAYTSSAYTSSAYTSSAYTSSAYTSSAYASSTVTSQGWPAPGVYTLSTDTAEVATYSATTSDSYQTPASSGWPSSSSAYDHTSHRHHHHHCETHSKNWDTMPMSDSMPKMCTKSTGMGPWESQATSTSWTDGGSGSYSTSGEASMKTHSHSKTGEAPMKTRSHSKTAATDSTPAYSTPTDSMATGVSTTMPTSVAAGSGM